ncbi:hypothetical protein V6N13_001532 [Hibiscus sabdariffa]|uniref:Uncharacterized protein n=1 Tax=Hibiscus sabdariffa TaxID=183260 RepID=A0ABR2G8L0_9ROSI
MGDDHISKHDRANLVDSLNKEVCEVVRMGVDTFEEINQDNLRKGDPKITAGVEPGPLVVRCYAYFSRNTRVNVAIDPTTSDVMRLSEVAISLFLEMERIVARMKARNFDAIFLRVE